MVGILKIMTAGTAANASDVNGINGFVGANAIINGLNTLKQTMTAGKPRISNEFMILDDLSSDSADSNTNWTYDSGADDYTTDNGQTSCTLEFHDLSTDSTKTIIPYWSALIDGTSTWTVSVSVDGGSNYFAVSNGEVYEFASAGTDVRIRFAVTKQSATEDVLYGFGIMRSSA